MLVKTKPTKPSHRDPILIAGTSKITLHLIIFSSAVTGDSFSIGLIYNQNKILKWLNAPDFIEYATDYVYVDLIKAINNILSRNLYLVLFYILQIWLCLVLYSLYLLRMKEYQRFCHSAMAAFFSSVLMALNLF